MWLHVSVIVVLFPLLYMIYVYTYDICLYILYICLYIDRYYSFSTASHIALHAWSVMSDSETPWTIALQAPLSMEFSWQEYWSRLPFPSPGDLRNPGIEATPLAHLLHW